jgi:tetratricopeptide (TPR) repeat protein
MKLFKYALVILFAALAAPAYAALDTTLDEIVTLPPYCDAKMGRKAPADVAYWQQMMGSENWIHTHHYCGGLVELNRYYRGAKGRKTANLGNAVNEFSGMIKAWPAGFFLVPEAYFNRGRAYKFGGQPGLALTDFQKAITANPRLHSARIELADLYLKSGKKKDALAVLLEGLEIAPDTKSLRRRYQELGGDLKTLPEAPVAAPTPTPVEQQPATNAAPVIPAPATVESDASPVPAMPPPVAPKIGNATNPYCRFCPDAPAPLPVPAPEPAPANPAPAPVTP